MLITKRLDGRERESVHEEEERVVEKLHAHDHHAFGNVADAPVGGYVVVDDGVRRVRYLDVKKEKNENQLQKEEKGEEGVQRGALDAVLDVESDPPREQSKGDEGGHEIRIERGAVSARKRNLELRLESIR